MIMRLNENCGRCRVRMRVARGELNVPFLVLFIPLGFPALRHLRRWRPGWRNKVSHVKGRRC